jgi:tetratricopeptide (TPR) repeat protein
MKRFLLQCILVPLLSVLLHGQRQSDMRILEYSVDAAINDNADGISGIASVWLQVTTDSLLVFRFTVPSSIEIIAVRDIDDDRYTHEPIPLMKTLFAHAVELPSYRFRNDSFLVKIEFETSFDTSSASPIFLNARECILPYSTADTWLPQFDQSSASRSSLRLTVPFNYTVIGGIPLTSSPAGEGGTLWEASRTDPVDLHDFFTLAGSASITELKRVSPDSMTIISLSVTAPRFHPRFADSLLSYLAEAAVFFRTVTGKYSGDFLQRFVVLGENQSENVILRTGNSIILRNSPAYTAYDSSVFFRTGRNRWLIELARSFCPAIKDSVPLFDHGWAGYLASRFVMERYNDDAVDRRERLDLMFTALSFYPSMPLSAGQTVHPYRSEILSSKGRYVFLMLEHLLGTPSFNSVITGFYLRNAVAPAGIQEFRLLCEQEYGSPLEQFFRQWLDRSSVPELVLGWKTENTLRGVALTTVSVEQRGDLFSIPITLSFSIGNKAVPKRVMVDQASHSFSFTFSSPPKKVEIDPQFSVLRWVLDYRILAHARSSQLYRVLDRNTAMATREAVLTLELDPVNATGSAPIAYYSLGAIAVVEGDLDQAKEYFIKAMQSNTVDESAVYPLLSLVRYANIVEMEGSRPEALPMYERAAEEGRKNPSLYATVIGEAEKYLRVPFVSSDDVWYGIH